jgi:hypothetical protein
MSIFSNARLPGEDFQTYRDRRRAVNRAIKLRLRAGTPHYVLQYTSRYGEERKGATYRKPVNAVKP